MPGGKKKSQNKSQKRNPEDSLTMTSQGENEMNETGLMEDDDMAFYSEITRGSTRKDMDEDENPI